MCTKFATLRASSLGEGGGGKKESLQQYLRNLNMKAYVL